MKNFKIKTKLIILFIIIKVLPLLLLSFIAIEGANRLHDYFESTTIKTFEKSKNIIEETANTAVSDSIKALDKKSQVAFERISYEIANNIASFLYERDKDILFLSKLELNDKILKEFYNTKVSKVVVSPEYFYNTTTNTWDLKEKIDSSVLIQKAELQENEKEFHANAQKNIIYKEIPIYKEIQVIGLDGKEIYKTSSLNPKKLDISNKSNTYCKAETYFNDLKNLKKDEIYVSEVIGAYVKTKVIGSYTKEKAQKAGIKFDPKKSAYAGTENPVGKRFEGIIRFATPIYKEGKKVGYVSFALDHRHIMEFSDSLDPLIENTRQNIADASSGNYAFIWDNVGRNISHPRDYFIVGFDSNNGERVPGWISADIAQKFKKSEEKNLNRFLENYPTFEEQSLKKKPYIEQLKSLGEVGLDCRYLNFAPQCQGWMQLTKDGGYGSFVIFWSNVWKLTTAATIPYYTGQYKNSKRGFGFVTIGANVDEFHLAANKTKENIDSILQDQIKQMENQLDDNKFNIMKYITELVNELTFFTVIMIFLIIVIAIWMSNMITNKIKNLLEGIKEYSKHNFEHKIKITSSDEIGELERSFNTMAEEIKSLIDKQNNSNLLLGVKVKEANDASKAKSEFLASMSHEIRTPLNSIIGFIDILVDKEENQEKQKYLKIVKQSSQNLLNIISDILDFSKIESNKIELDFVKINPYEKFEEIAQQFVVSTTNKDIAFNVSISNELSKCIQLDIFRVTQVINNLLSNAVKFTNEGGCIDFNVEYNAKEDELMISVADTGIGISKDKIQTIFEPFNQADNSTTRNYGGTGLGLTISVKLVELMGGKLQLDTNREKGAKFYFNIQLKKCNSCNIPQSDNPFTPVAPKKLDFVTDLTIPNIPSLDLKVLVVEDNVSNQVFMKVFLKKLSLNYTIVNNGKEAVDIYKKEKFSIIFMDENMPVMSGMEATKEIREYEKQIGKYTPIIALSANAFKDDKELFKKAGMDDYLSKPLKKESFVEVIKKYLDIELD